MYVGLKIEGLAELRSSLRKVGKEYPAELARINEDAAVIVARAAVPRAPKRSGKLRLSIRAKGSTYAGRVYAGGGRGEFGVPYAGPIHWGWPRRNISPQPFLVEAASARRWEVVDLVQTRTDRLIDRVWETIT